MTTVVNLSGGVALSANIARRCSMPAMLASASSRASLPNDPIGNFNLTLTNLVVGSSVQLESQDGTTTLYNGTASSSSTLINLQAYAGGSPLNSLLIKVRKGSSSPYYRPYETLATAIVGSQSLYVSQIPDE